MLPLLAPTVGMEDDVCYTIANSSPTTLAHAICQALNAHTLFDRPLPACPAGGKGGNYDGGTVGGSQS
jgi:hypothetical protein